MGDKLIIGLVALIAGAAGGFGASKLADSATTDAPAGDVASGAFEDRLAALEADIAALQQPAALTGSADSPIGTHGGTPVTVAQLDALKAKLADDMQTAIKKQVDERMAELGPDAEAVSTATRRPRAKRVSLADAARELGLSSAEEDEVRQVYLSTTEDTLKLLAGEEGDIEEVRKDLAEVSKDPEGAGMRVMAKYGPRIFPAKIGEFLQIRQREQQGLVKAVGEDRARKLNREFVVEESDPWGMRGRGRSGFRMSAGFGGGR